MSNNGQYSSPNRGNNPEKGDYQSGMLFVRRKGVKHRFTLRDLTVLIGIAIALIIFFTIWLKQPPVERPAEKQRSGLMPRIITPVSERFVEIVGEIVF